MKNNPPNIDRKLSAIMAAEETAGTNSPARNMPLAMSMNKSASFSIWELVSHIFFILAFEGTGVNEYTSAHALPGL